MKYIKLTRGKQAKICDCHYELVASFKWQCGSHGYAMREQHISYINKVKKRKTVMMHRLIMDTPKDMDTDHINGDKLDNRCSNLRVCTTSQNAMNRASVSKCGVKGVTERKNGRWQAHIGFKGKQETIGTFDTIYEAAMAYNKRAKELYGNFAKTNRLAQRI